MKKIIAIVGFAAALSMPAVSAHANGWGNSHKNYSGGGLLNLSASVNLGNISLLNGLGILNNSSIASGILSNNNTGIGVLGTGTGVFKNQVNHSWKGKRGRR